MREGARGGGGADIPLWRVSTARAGTCSHPSSASPAAPSSDPAARRPPRLFPLNLPLRLASPRTGAVSLASPQQRRRAKRVGPPPPADGGGGLAVR